MKTWYVKKLSKLTKTSIRTLHYYDKIGVLKPSARLANGYRVYSEYDLVKLEQIIALKFFGFTLSHIRTLLNNEVDSLGYLRAQLRLLHAEASYLQNTQKSLLTAAITELEENKTVNWHRIVELIEAYAKTKELKRSSVTNELLKYTNSDNNELNDYLNIPQEPPKDLNEKP